MTISMYDVSVSVFTRGLAQLSHVLDKGVAHVKAADGDPAALVQARLAPDMLTLAGQVQRASDASKFGVARIAGVTAPSFADTEVSFEELQSRIAKTVEFLNSVDRAEIDGHEDRSISLKVGGHELTLDAQRYLLQFALPNFFFHVTTAYDVLRNAGVPVGKQDYLGRF